MTEAGDGEEALARTRVARPELVICDILMPTMDGYEFVRRLRAEPEVASTPVIFYSAIYHEREAEALATSCGVQHLLTKPAEPEMILAVVTRALSHGPNVAPEIPVEQFGQAHARVLADKLSDRQAALEAANLRLSALLAAVYQLSCEQDRRTMLRELCDAAREITGARYTVVGLEESDPAGQPSFRQRYGREICIHG